MTAIFLQVTEMRIQTSTYRSSKMTILLIVALITIVLNLGNFCNRLHFMNNQRVDQSCGSLIQFLAPSGGRVFHDGNMIPTTIVTMRYGSMRKQQDSQFHGIPRRRFQTSIRDHARHDHVLNPMLAQLEIQIRIGKATK